MSDDAPYAPSRVVPTLAKSLATCGGWLKKYYQQRECMCVCNVVCINFCMMAQESEEGRVLAYVRCVMCVCGEWVGGGGACVCMCRGGGGEKEITLGSPTVKEDIMYLHPGGKWRFMRVEMHGGGDGLISQRQTRWDQHAKCEERRDDGTEGRFCVCAEASRALWTAFFCKKRTSTRYRKPS